MNIIDMCLYTMMRCHLIIVFFAIVLVFAIYCSMRARQFDATTVSGGGEKSLLYCTSLPDTMLF